MNCALCGGAHYYHDCPYNNTSGPTHDASGVGGLGFFFGALIGMGIKAIVDADKEYSSNSYGTSLQSGGASSYRTNSASGSKYTYHANGRNARSGGRYAYHENGSSALSGSYAYHDNGSSAYSSGYAYYRNGRSAKSGSYFYNINGSSLNNCKHLWINLGRNIDLYVNEHRAMIRVLGDDIWID